MSKKIILVVSCVLLFAMLVPYCAMASSTYYVYTANGGSLNLRKEAVTHTNNVVAKLPFGTAVSVDTSITGVKAGWCYVSASVNGKTVKGFVQSRYLSATKKTKPATKKTTTTKSTNATTVAGLPFSSMKAVDEYTVYASPVRAAGHVNVRWAPSTNATVETAMYDGMSMTVIATNGTWAQVRIDSTGAVGFVLLKYTRVNQ